MQAYILAGRAMKRCFIAVEQCSTGNINKDCIMQVQMFR